MCRNWPSHTVTACKAVFEPNFPTSLTRPDNWGSWPKLCWVNYSMRPRNWTWSAESGSLGHISWNRWHSELWGSHTQRGRWSWSTPNEKGRGAWVPERRYLRGQHPEPKAFWSLPKPPTLVIPGIHEITLYPQSKTPVLFTFSQYMCVYNWPLNNVGGGGRGTALPRTQIPPTNAQLKSICNFWFPQNLTTNSLLLTGSLTDNISFWLKHIFYVIPIIYCIFTIKEAREKKMLLTKW